MKRVRLFVMGMMFAATAIVGCSQQSTAPEADNKDKKHKPHGKGPNGGVVVDLGAYHAEFTVDHPNASCTILILGQDEQTPTAVASGGFTVKTNATKTKEGKDVPALTIKLAPVDAKDGKASKFVGKDPGLANVADFEGTIVGEIDGKGAQQTFKEE